ncbi:sphingosine N-acyltransferase lag1, partial [Ascosphaera atra]
MLKYLGHESACNAVFALFFVSWLIPRHVIYNMLWYSIYREVPSVMPYGCHSTTTPMTSNSTTPSSSSTTFDADAVNDWTHLFYPLTTTGTFSEATICMSRPIKWGFLTVLAFLQGLSLVWFGMNDG